MTIFASDFRTYVVNPALGALVLAGIPVTQVAADLLIATAAVESQLGTYLVQRPNGPALGVFQIQPASQARVISSLTSVQARALATVSTPQSPITQVVTNLVFAAAIARLYYWQEPAALPQRSEKGLWGYYKQYWNTFAGATTEAKFIAALKITDIVF